MKLLRASASFPRETAGTVFQRGAGKESAAPGEFRYFHLWSFRGRRVIRLEVIRSRDAALEAAGLSE